MNGMHNRRVEQKLTKALDQSGAVAVLMVAAFVVLCGFAALAVDIGHMIVVKAELQRAADAGALSGAVALSPTMGSTLTPLWSNGQTAAANTVNDAYNKADNVKSEISTTDVIAGYWLLNPQDQNQTFPQNIPLNTYMPVPAIKVTLSRSVSLFFATVINANAQQTVSATSIAVMPVSFKTAPFSMAVEKDIVVYPDGHGIQLSPQDFGWHDHAQWYTTDGSNDVPTIRKNVPITVGAQIYIAPGAMATLYSTIIYPQTIIVPVVESTDQKKWQTILGYAAFEITGVDSKSISGYFLNKYFSPEAIPDTGEGFYYGVSGTSKLVGP